MNIVLDAVVGISHGSNFVPMFQLTSGSDLISNSRFLEHRRSLNRGFVRQRQFIVFNVLLDHGKWARCALNIKHFDCIEKLHQASEVIRELSVYLFMMDHRARASSARLLTNGFTKFCKVRRSYPSIDTRERNFMIFQFEEYELLYTPMFPLSEYDGVLTGRVINNHPAK